MPRRHPKPNRQRLLIAQQAARILDQAGNRDYYAAKRKAAEHLGIFDTRNLPSNSEIEQALIEHQRIFHSETQPQQLHALREAALQAMELFGPFDPRLVGAVLKGTADTHSPIHLHVFTDTSEELNLFLLQHHIPFEVSEQRLRFDAEKIETYPAFHFIAGEHHVQLTVFPKHGKRRAPLSPVDARPMQRASLEEVAALLDQDQQTHYAG